MRNGFFFTVVLGVTGFCTLLSAQQPVLPPGPLLAVPRAAAWQLTVMQKTDAPQQPGYTEKPSPPKVFEVRSVEIQGKIRHEESKGANGEQVSIWCTDTLEYFKCTPSPKYFICSPADTQFYVIKPGILFNELAWISKDKFLGTKNVDGKPCLVFGDTHEPPSPDDLASLLQEETSENGILKYQPSIQRIAYVDSATRLPIYAQDNKALYVYQFGAPPAYTLTLPAEIQALQRARDAQIRMLSAQPSKS